MIRYGLLINIEWCTGCHTCEAACKQEHQFPLGQWGIKLAENGPWEISPDNWQYDFIAIPTKQCDLCEDRVSMGKLPTCVQHCQAACMKYGPVSELVKEMEENPRTVLFAPR